LIRFFIYKANVTKHMHNYITLAGYKLDSVFRKKLILLIKTLFIPASTKQNARKIRSMIEFYGHLYCYPPNRRQSCGSC